VIISTDAVILRSRKYGETSRIVTLYTRELGKLPTIAKGVRGGGKGRRVLPMDPTSVVRAVIYVRETREIQLLTQCDPIESLDALHSDLARMGAGMGIVELTDLVTPPGEASEELYGLLCGTLLGLRHATSNAENALYFYEARLLGILGFRPELHRCVGCRVMVLEEERAGEVRVSASGIVCRRCAADHRGLLSVTPPALRILQRMQEVESVDPILRITLTPAVKSELARILHLFLQSHAEGYRVLKSQEVFAAIASG
jgi:DNA repair protein RecO (recombination protein O)